jgi:hypothetical protein
MMGSTGSSDGGDKKCIQKFGGEISKNAISWRPEGMEEQY